MVRRLQPRPADQQTVSDLIAVVTARTLSGEDFPTIWNELLRDHPLVAGIPIQVHVGAEPALKIELVTGHALVMREGEFFLEP